MPNRALAQKQTTRKQKTSDAVHANNDSKVKPISTCAPCIGSKLSSDGVSHMSKGSDVQHTDDKVVKLVEKKLHLEKLNFENQMKNLKFTVMQEAIEFVKKMTN